jgi:phage gpG-like protein
MMRVRVTADPKLARAMKKLQDPKTVEKMLENALAVGALQIANAAKEKAPVKTGNLKRSIHIGGHTDIDPQMASDLAESGGHDLGRVGHYANHQVRVLIGTDLIYARIQEYGGTIEAKHAPYLRFKTADGKWHAVKSVTIPARSYLRAAADERKAKAVADMRDALADQLRKQVATL